MLDDKRLHLISVLGGPTAGKTTHANKLSHILELPVISSGDIVRRSLNRGDDTYLRCLCGDLPPPVAIAKDICSAWRSLGRPSKVIIDGFPRAADQIDALFCLTRTRVVSWKTIYLHVSPSVMHERARMRGRPDDWAATLNQRLLLANQHYDTLKQKLSSLGTFTDLSCSASTGRVVSALRQHLIAEEQP